MNGFDKAFTELLLNGKSRHNNVQMNTQTAGVVRYTGFSSIDGSELVAYCKENMKRAVVTFETPDAVPVFVLDVYDCETSDALHNGVKLDASTCSDFFKCPESLDVADNTKVQTLFVKTLSSEAISKLLKDSAVIQITLRSSSRLKVITLTKPILRGCQKLQPKHPALKRKQNGWIRTRNSALKLQKQKKKKLEAKRPKRMLSTLLGYA